MESTVALGKPKPNYRGPLAYNLQLQEKHDSLHSLGLETFRSRYRDSKMECHDGKGQGNGTGEFGHALLLRTSS